MRNKEILKRQEQLLREVDFLAKTLPRNERITTESKVLVIEKGDNAYEI